MLLTGLLFLWVFGLGYAVGRFDGIGRGRKLAEEERLELSKPLTPRSLDY